MKERILYYDCFSGISGDMNLGAMVDLGVPESYIKDELKKIDLTGYELMFSPSSKQGIHGTRADVDIGPRFSKVKERPLLAQDDTHKHNRYSDIRLLIESSGLSDGAKNRALAILKKLAEAEASVHAQPVEEVQFHEVGAVDSIVDIVGAAICLEYLKVDRVLASRVELGGGFVKCQHGVIPVPAPAVTKLLEGVPVKSGSVQFETTTPTGAAILCATVDEFTDDTRFTIEKTAYGVGHRDMEKPNLLRLYLGARDIESDLARAILLECNIDDMSPEIHSYLFDALFAAGAQDVWITPIVMKKSRSAITLSVLCAPDKENEMVKILFSESTSLGIRRTEIQKYALERTIETVLTSLGEVRVKMAFLDGKQMRAKPEYEDVKRIALARGMAFIEAQRTIQRELEI